MATWYTSTSATDSWVTITNSTWSTTSATTTYTDAWTDNNSYSNNHWKIKENEDKRKAKARIREFAKDFDANLRRRILDFSIEKDSHAKRLIKLLKRSMQFSQLSDNLISLLMVRNLNPYAINPGMKRHDLFIYALPATISGQLRNCKKAAYKLFEKAIINKVKM